jgi:hypothetical protein
MFRLVAAVLALPLVATAAVSALSSGGAWPLADKLFDLQRSTHQMNASYRHHLVSVDELGVVRGRLVNAAAGVRGLENMKVFFVRDGELASQVYTREDGTFEAVGLREGDYSFVATGANGFAAFGVRLTQLPNELTNNLMEVGAASPQFEKVIALLKDKLPVEVTAEIESATAATLAAGANRVRIESGRLSGRLAGLNGSAAGAEVHLIGTGDTEFRATADGEGNFTVEGVEPGVYEFVATGKTGVAVLRFEAVQEEGSVVAETSQVISDSAAGFDAAMPAGSLDVAMTAPSDQMMVSDQFNYACDSCGTGSYAEPYANAATEIGCGTAAGGCCGSSGNWSGYSSCGGGCGGGGGAGLGGLGGIAKFAILGWILTELFNEIDFSNPNPASPNNT